MIVDVAVGVADGGGVIVDVAVGVGLLGGVTVGVGLGQPPPPPLLRCHTSLRNWKVAPFMPPTAQISPFPKNPAWAAWREALADQAVMGSRFHRASLTHRAH